MDNPRKITAAMTAVLAYIQEEEAAVLQAEAAPQPEKPAVAPKPNLWGMSGRQEIMQMGTLMQMKALKR